MMEICIVSCNRKKKFLFDYFLFGTVTEFRSVEHFQLLRKDKIEKLRHVYL